MPKNKIALVGSGQIGGTIALLAASKNIAVSMLDATDGIAAGKALDISSASPLFSGQVCKACTSYEELLKDANVVIVTAGVPRKPGMSRDDLLSVNARVMKMVAEQVGKYAKDAFVIIVTNPLDAMVSFFQRISALPSAHVVGMAGVLDSARFRYFLSEALSVAAEDIHALVLGGHGDSMVPLIRHSSVAGISLSDLIGVSISQEKIDSIIERTRNGGAEVVNLLKTGSAFYAPALSALEMAESYLNDKRRVLPCSCMLNGEYGVDGLYVGVPSVIGKNGVEKIIELDLNDEERVAFNKSVAAVKELVDRVLALEANLG